MNEHVLAAVVAGDETEALGLVEPLDRTAERNGGRRVGSDATRARFAAGERTLGALDDAGRIDFQHTRHLGALGAGADDDLELCACGHCVVA